jgi:hypothetical protein
LHKYAYKSHTNKSAFIKISPQYNSMHAKSLSSKGGSGKPGFSATSPKKEGIANRPSVSRVRELLGEGSLEEVSRFRRVAIPAVRGIVRNPEEGLDMRIYAAEALLSLTDEQSAMSLETALSHVLLTRQIEFLAQGRPAAHGLIGILKKEQESPFVKNNAIDGLSEYACAEPPGPSGEDSEEEQGRKRRILKNHRNFVGIFIIPELVRLAKHDSEKSVKGNAIFALALIGSLCDANSIRVLPELRRMLTLFSDDSSLLGFVGAAMDEVSEPGECLEETAPYRLDTGESGS